MQNKIEFYIQKKREFQPYNKEPETLFLYIAPLDVNVREMFFGIIIKRLLIPKPRHLILSDDNLVMNILADNFAHDIELDIFISYISSRPVEFNQSLKDYIKEHDIDFEY